MFSRSIEAATRRVVLITGLGILDICLGFAISSNRALAQPLTPDVRYFNAVNGRLNEPCVFVDGLYYSGTLTILNSGNDIFTLLPVSVEEISQPGDNCSELLEIKGQPTYQTGPIFIGEVIDGQLYGTGESYRLTAIAEGSQYPVTRALEIRNERTDDFQANINIDNNLPQTVSGPILNTLPFDNNDNQLTAELSFSFDGSASFDASNNTLTLRLSSNNNKGIYNLNLRLSNPEDPLFQTQASYLIDYTGATPDQDPDPIPDNYPPTFNAPSTLTLPEDSAAQLLPSWATAISPGIAAESAQTVSFTVSNNNNGLFTTQPVLDDNGTLSFATAPDAFGTATVSIIATDSEGATSGTHVLHLTVSAINDAPAFAIQPTINANEDDPAQTIANWATGLSVGPANESTQTLNFTVSNDNNSLFAIQPALSANGTLSYTLAADVSGTATLTFNADDGAGGTAGPSTSTINVAAVNDAPEFVAASDTMTLSEDAGPQTLSNWASSISPGPVDEAAQTVSFTTTNTNNALFSVQPEVAVDGTLTFTPADDANGIATISVTANDSVGASSVARTLDLTVTAINDDPAFTVPATIAVTEDAGATTLNGWATGLSVGPANESTQSLSLTTSNDNNALFSVQPSLAADGTLTFTPAANANGMATLTINASDGAGGTAGPETTTLTVSPVNDAPVPELPSSVSGFEDTIIVVYVGSDGDVENDNYTFALSGTNDNGSYYFPKNTLNVADRITETSFSTFGTTDILNELFDPVSVSDASFTEFSGSSARFSSGFVFAFVPDANEIGTDDFKVVLRDVHGATSAPADVTLTISSVNDAPLIKQAGVAVSGDTKQIISFNNEFIGDPYTQADDIVVSYPAATDRTDFKLLGTSFTENDFAGFESEEIEFTVSTTLPASGSNDLNYDSCAVRMESSGGAQTFLAFDGQAYSSDDHSYTEARQLIQSLAVNCRGAATGQVTLDISDTGIRGSCPPGHPENYANEEFIDIVDRRCTRNSQIVFDVTFTD